MNKVAVFAQSKHQAAFQSMEYTLGMAQLQPDGLSEQWFLKTAGDVHWCLIAKAMGQTQALFEDVNGNAVYAAFCTTSLSLTPAVNLLAKNVTISSHLYQVCAHQIGSLHNVFCCGKVIASLQMISTFVSHGNDKSNRSIVRNKFMPQLFLETAPDSLKALANRARSIAREPIGNMSLAKPVFDVAPCRSLDFNAVGLLYFPSFSKYAERAESYNNADIKPLLRRDVIYLGNADYNTSLSLFATERDVFIKRDDGQLIAKVTTLRSDEKLGTI